MANLYLERQRHRRQMESIRNNLLSFASGMIIGCMVGSALAPAAASSPSDVKELEPETVQAQTATCASSAAQPDSCAYNDPDIPDEVEEAAQAAGAAYSIAPELLEAIAWYESSYDAQAVNGDCIGLMQVSVRWHLDRMAALGIDEGGLYDAEANMTVAADYLVELLKQNNDLVWALMTYNGDSKAGAYLRGTAEASTYAQNVITLADELQEKHSKADEEVVRMLAEQ